ncbi:hypothetical protein M9458_057027, partial [Cirrhinus mrigala]
MESQHPENPDYFEELVDMLRTALQQPPVISSPSAPACSMAKPAAFSGEVSECSGFLLQCSLYFKMLPQQFINDHAKITFIISLLSGRARQLAQSMWNTNSPVTRSQERFVAHFREVFGTCTSSLSVHDELFRLQQAKQSIHEYTLHFPTLAASSEWNETALLSAYRRGLNPRIQQQMTIFDNTVGLESFMQKALHISQHLNAAQLDSQPMSDTSPGPAPPTSEPMQTDKYHLSHAEKVRRRQLNLCLYCGQGHIVRTCPMRPTPPVVSTIHINSTAMNIPHNDGLLILAQKSVPVKTLLDSGSSGNFISSHLFKPHKIPRLKNPTTCQIIKIQGKPLGQGMVTSCTPTLKLRLPDRHKEEISFLVLGGCYCGYPQHQPVIKWETSDIQQWSDFCLTHCFKALHEEDFALIGSTSIESPHSSDSGEIPLAYWAFQDMFSKSAATRLPPHRPWHCAIDLLPGATLPKGHIYPLSISETQAMEEYIKEALSQGFIRPSTSLAASSFFFVGKKDRGLRPCIDYRHLNSQTVKFSYPLPLVPTALEELRGVKVFSKLDLR